MDCTISLGSCKRQIKKKGGAKVLAPALDGRQFSNPGESNQLGNTPSDTYERCTADGNIHSVRRAHHNHPDDDECGANESDMSSPNKVGQGSREWCYRGGREAACRSKPGDRFCSADIFDRVCYYKYSLQDRWCRKEEGGSPSAAVMKRIGVADVTISQMRDNNTMKRLKVIGG